MSVMHKIFGILVQRSHGSFRCVSQNSPSPLRITKKKSQRSSWARAFVDARPVRVQAGKGGDGFVCFMQLWCNPDAGPSGGNGGHGGHVIFKANSNTYDFSHLSSVIKGKNGEKGHSKGCDGCNAKHTIIKVPVGTIIKNIKSVIVGDLSKDGSMFLAARGGAGGKGNSFFTTDTFQAPSIAECGAEGEEYVYFLEVMSMAHVGLIGYPNAGKSTLLQAISRAKPKVAPYPFTTLKPHIGVVAYDDLEKIAVADLPGLIEDSHLNKGLGISFLKHAERCRVLLFLLDTSCEKPWEKYYVLRNELNQYSPGMTKRPCLVIANKIDLPSAQENLDELKRKISLPIITISAKYGMNIENLLHEIRKLYDTSINVSDDVNKC